MNAQEPYFNDWEICERLENGCYLKCAIRFSLVLYLNVVAPKRVWKHLFPEKGNFIADMSVRRVNEFGSVILSSLVRCVLGNCAKKTPFL